MLQGLWRTVVPALACLALAGCFLQPGKFDSTLDLRQDGTFTFSYKGQIYMLALSKLAEESAKADQNDMFTPEKCTDHDFKDRPCSAAELAEQKRQWQEQKQQKLAQDKQNAEAMRAMLGGIDPNDPKAAEEFAARLQRQAGWRQVTYDGDGLFEVDFTLTSRLTHDFAFPTIEQFSMNDFFVVITRRQDGTARIEAPGFSPQDSGNPMQAMMAAMSGSLTPDGATGADKPAKPAAPKIPEMAGTFRIVTDGQILANNTDEGPHAGAGKQVLQWAISPRTKSAPMALVKLTP